MSKEYHDKLMITLSNQTDKLVDELPDFAKKFFDNLFNSGMSERTRMQYAHDMKKFFNYLQNSAGFKDVNMKTLRADEVLDRINIDDINEYLRSISISLSNDGSKKPTSPAYKARQVCSLRAFYKYYYKIGAIKNNIYDLIAVPKINDKQIRCTLNQKDLSDREIRISELAYGTDKAKKLFRDMMQQAQIQFGFEADNIPLMIEAIPVSTESIILIITKVEDPEELDTRFSKFAPFKGNEKTDTVQLDGADNIIDIFQKLYEAKVKSAQNKEKSASRNTPPADKDNAQMPDVNLIRLYEFDTLDDVIAAAHGLNGYFTGINTLYKDPADDIYKLVIHQSSISPEEFNKVCNILTEYGRGRAFTLSGEAYLTEHGELISTSALQQLVQL